MWELVKRSLQRERSMAGAQLVRPRRASVQRMHNEIVETFLKAGRQAKGSEAGSFSSVDRVVSEGRRGMRGGIWRAVSNLGFAIAMAIRLLNPYVLISAAFGQHRSLLAHLSARVDSMRAVLSPRTGRRRRLTAWIQDTLPQRHVPEAATAIWEDGSLLCGIVETAVPGACPGYDGLSHPNTDRSATLGLGQKLVARYLGVPPVFSEEDLSKPFLSISMERRLLRYLSAVRLAAARVEAERQKRFKATEGVPSIFEDDGLSSDCIVQSAIHPEGSMLECVARGMGLILGVKGRRSTFYLYPNPNHPHRHVHRLMQNTYRQLGIQNMDDEAGAILMQIRGPEGDFGATLISTAPGSSSNSKGSSMEVLNEQWCGRIPITYTTTEESVRVSFIPQSVGSHELTLLLRGGSHVPGSPFCVSVEDALDVPDDGGTFTRFGSGRMKKWKASSHESGLDRVYRHSESGDSDPGVRGIEDRALRQRRRVVSRVVDFVTEKMLLTEDGKLQRLPKQSRRNLERKSGEGEAATTRGENPAHSRRRYFTTVSPTRSRIRQRESNVQVTDQNRNSAAEACKILAEDDSMLEAEREIAEELRCEEIPAIGNELMKGNLEKSLRVSDVAEQASLAISNPVDFRDHCRRILWLCDILLKHRPRQESLEILNTAGDILVGKRVHPTILEESEPEELPGNNAVMVQRLQRTRSDTGGLNEVLKWKENRRRLHTWARPDRGGSMVGGRLLHKGGSYRGIVVRDLNAEAITGAYAGGEDSKDEGEEADTEEEEKMRQYLRDGRPAPRKPHFSIPKRKAASHKKMSENRGTSTDSLEPITSSDAETDTGTGISSGITPMQKKKPPPSAPSSPDSESDPIERSFLSTPTTAIRRHSDVTAMRPQSALLSRRRGSGDLGTPRKADESKKRFTRARQFFETLEQGKEKHSNACQSGGEEEAMQTTKKKKKKGRGTVTDDEAGRSSTRKPSSKRRSPLRCLGVGDSSESTPDSDKQAMESERLHQRRKSRRGSCDMIHSAPGSDVDTLGETLPSTSQRRKKGSELVLRSRDFGGSERQPRVSERFNVMDLFRDVAGFGTGGGGDLSGRATPLGIPHQAAVLAALRSVEDVQSSDATSPYDTYDVEAADDCEPTSAVSQDENANLEGAEDEDNNVTFGAPVRPESTSAKQEYQAEYPHLPMTSPRYSRHRSSNFDLIPRKVLLQLDNSKSGATISTSRRSSAELF